MQTNSYDKTSVHGCTGACYEQWENETGGVLVIAQAKAAAKADASPAELGKAIYMDCVACHGAGAEGGVQHTLYTLQERAYKAAFEIKSISIASNINSDRIFISLL